MEVIEAEMNTLMQELAKLDTQLGLREIEEETEGDFGIVEEEEEDDDDDNGMDGSMDEDTQNFKRIDDLKCTYRHPRSVLNENEKLL